LTFVLVRS